MDATLGQIVTRDYIFCAIRTREQYTIWNSILHMETAPRANPPRKYHIIIVNYIQLFRCSSSWIYLYFHLYSFFFSLQIFCKWWIGFIKHVESIAFTITNRNRTVSQNVYAKEKKIQILVETANIRSSRVCEYYIHNLHSTHIRHSLKKITLNGSDFAIRNIREAIFLFECFY